MTEELFEQGLLRKEAPSKEKAARSLERAEKYIGFAQKNLHMGLFETAIMLAYNAMFHTARAVAFKDGVVERSHFALIKYLEETHGSRLNRGMINKLDFYRKIRHSLSYDLDSKADREQGERAIEFAGKFLKEVREYLQ